ncbi:MAG: cytochrome P450 [Actinomycetota bacterium]|nr:cytochrome P450 [Actinomycetota bacterium]
MADSGNRRADRARRGLFGLVDELVNQRRRAGIGGDDLLSLLLATRDPETGAALDHDAIRDEALIFLIAGHETTGSALPFALDLLGGHDAVHQRVRAEVERVLGDGVPTADDVEQLSYTARVINEALRLYPPAHTLVRRACDDGELLGRQLPAGRIVTVSIWEIHRRA